MSRVSDSGEGLISGALHIDPLCGLNPSEASWLKVQTGGKKKKKKTESDIEAEDENFKVKRGRKEAECGEFNKPLPLLSAQQMETELCVCFVINEGACQ